VNVAGEFCGGPHDGGRFNPRCEDTADGIQDAVLVDHTGFDEFGESYVRRSGEPVLEDDTLVYFFDYKGRVRD
jgi:hypothetical protein